MAISIVNNSTAIASGMQVNSANNALSNTIKSLSTGLRINTAADDASGLAVSEKLRGQISGLAKAATNAQDATSLLQTAEAAMGSMTDVIQRMRELAVQAGNPAYTTNDRAVLQLELDQLLDEVDRISNSTEFNTKKLLNGDASAIWSSSNNDIDAIITGTVEPGDYKLTYDISPGDNAIYKTNIMAVADDKLSYRMTANATTITQVSNIEGMMPTEAIGTAASTKQTLTVNGSAAYTATAGLTGKTGFTSVTTATINTIAASDAATSASGNSYYIEFEAMSDRSANGTAQVRFRVTNAETGEQSDWIEDTVNATGGIANGSSHTTLAGFSSSVVESTMGLFGTGAFEDGDKLLVGVSGTLGATAGAGSIQVTSTSATVIITAGFTNNVSEVTHTIYTAQIDDAGNVYYGNLDFTLGKGAVGNTGTEAQMQILGSGDTASENTLLKDLAGFVTSDGRNVLDNTQSLTMYANGNQVTVYLEGSDTVADLEKKLTDALVYELEIGADDTNPNAVEVNKNLVNFINTEGESTMNSSEAIVGTFSIQSALLGPNSEIRFVGDQNVINALGISTVQEATDSQLNVRVNDATNGKYIGEDVVTDNTLRGIIANVDVKIEPASAADVSWNTASKTMEFTSKVESTEVYLHLTDNSTQAAIGANEGQTLDLSIGRLDTIGLGIDGITIESFDSAQKSITKIDMALETLSSARATTGAQMNRLGYAIESLDVARENLTASESRIRDLDIAAASSELAAQQVLMQSASAMLAQANQLPSYAAQLIQG